MAVYPIYIEWGAVYENIYTEQGDGLFITDVH